jgi:hypothetical protein
MLDHNAFRGHLQDGPKLSGLTTIEEQAWCAWYAAEVYTGAGVIVEWGPWLGSLTRSYCRGLRQNQHITKGEPIAYLYDLFKWQEWCENEARGTVHEGRFSNGESFEPYFREINEDLLDFLHVRTADLSNCVWSGRPIELIINDAIKSLPIAGSTFKRFLPHLLPGKGLIAHQDFLWPTEAFLVVLMFLARESFCFEFSVPDSCMVVFRCEKPFAPEEIWFPGQFHEIPEALFDEAFDWVLSILPPRCHAMAKLGKAVNMHRAGLLDQAREFVDRENLASPIGDGLYDFQLDVLRKWGYGELLEQR